MSVSVLACLASLASTQVLCGYVEEGACARVCTAQPSGAPPGAGATCEP